MNTLRHSIEITYNNANISRDISADLLSFDYTDNESGKADDIKIKLKNEHLRWVNAWFPDKGATLKASIVRHQGGRTSSFYCGTFQIDELDATFSPNEFEIGGVSVPLDKRVRRDTKSKAWEKAALSEIAGYVANNGGLQLMFDVEVDPIYDRIDQRNESDLAFLQRVCNSEGISLKVTDEKLAVFSQKKYEGKAPILTIICGESDIVGSPKFSSQAYDLYKECKVSYFDPKKKKYISKTFSDPNVKSGELHKLNKRCESLAEAERLAKAKLRELNKGEFTGDMSLMGNFSLVSGAVVAVKGFGRYDGNYLIETARHSVGSGYVTSINIRRKLEGY